jgi:ferredoxin
MADIMHKIKFTVSNREIMVNENQRILDVMLANKIPVQYKCRTGECYECALIGSGSVYDLINNVTKDMNKEMFLTCQSVAKSDLEIEA